MAEAALFGIATSVLKQLASPALDEFRLLWGHKEQFEKLKNTVTTIQKVLKDADRRQANDAAVQEWLARLRAVLYEADDLLDAISGKVLLDKAKKGKKVHRILSKPYRFTFLVKNAHKVKKIREHFDDIARDINGFKFLQNQTELDATSRIRREETHSFVLRNEVVGREQETEEVVRMLLGDSSQQQISGVSVVAIIGIGGLGKTTLAQLVYNDVRVKKDFDLFMWACINNITDLKQVLITPLKSVTMREPENVNLDQLQLLFREEIEGKRFLLVLDDVWDVDLQTWRKLKELLSSGKDGSMVLTTTRSNAIAQRLWAMKPYFHLQVLSDESAWLLFKKIAFTNEEDWNNSELEQLGRLIERKCANVPLAIVITASLLREKEKERWPLVNDELSKLFPEGYDNIMQVLEFSYKELPYPVKRCFGYCSLFPKDYKFEKDRLIHLWIAQGFLEPLMNQSLEDRGEEYFFFLVDRCFFHHHSMYATTYQMHDLIHDLAIEVAGSESIVVDRTRDSWDKTVRHVSINDESKSIVDHVCSFPYLKSLRTFFYPNTHFRKLLNVEKLMSSFKSLRVLILWRIEEVPASIGELIHLRYLDLSENSMKRLPSSICSLCHLQYLILQKGYYLEELPEDLGELIQLRHLDLSRNYEMKRLPSSICGLLHLESLILEGCDKLVIPMSTLTSLLILYKRGLHIPSGALNYLENLRLTGSLQIVLPLIELENSKTDAMRSFRESRLRAVAIICEIRSDTEINDIRLQHESWGFFMRRPRRLNLLLEPATTNTEVNARQLPPNVVYFRIIYFGGEEIPHWVSCLKQLGTLILNGCKRCVKLPPFSDLPSLKELEICGMSSLLTIEDINFYKPNSFFPSLQTLSIGKMLNLTSWWLQPPMVLPTFPRLTKVSICDCPNLTRFLPLCPLVENLCLEKVREEIIWHLIGSEAIYSTTDGNSVLKELQIFQIGDLSNIAEAQVRHFSALQHLSIYQCDQLESVVVNGLTSLKHVLISRCGQLESVVVNGLASLERFKIDENCENLIIEHNFNEELQEEDEDEEGLQWEYLQELKIICLAFGEGFSMRNNQRLLNGFQHLTSLYRLELSKCKELYLPWRALVGLPNLQKMRIEEVEEVIDVDSDGIMIQTQPICRSSMELIIEGGSGEWLHDIPWKSLPFLEHLHLDSLINLKSLPKGIQHLVALKRLMIWDIASVVSLPDWMSSLSSLSYLDMRGISSELEKRCVRAKGEDWPKILHIPYISISRLSKESRRNLQAVRRYYSQQWRIWAANYIQVAWRRYRKRVNDGVVSSRNNSLWRIG